MSIVEVEHLTKEFRLGQLHSLRVALSSLASRARGEASQGVSPFKALDDVSMTIDRGEVVGLIGHNGAGKSTLLKLLSRITMPTLGSVRVQGRISPLIEVGGGLMADLTGRENIYLNGTILGMSRAEIRRKFDEIVEFAELQRFVDTPLKRYSSGMQIRLGFSVATAVDADILLIDEVLAVGDIAFQRKCFDRIEKIIADQSKTLLVVGHNIRQIERICQRGILLDHGRVAMDGPVGEVCTAFLDATQKRINREQLQRFERVGAEFTTHQIEVTRIQSGFEPQEAGSSKARGGRIRIAVELIAHQPIPDAEIVIGLQTPDLLYVTECSSAAQGIRPDLGEGLNTLEFTVDDEALRDGVYGVSLAIYDRLGRVLWRGDNLAPFEIDRPASGNSAIPLRGLVDLPCQWQAVSQEVPRERRFDAQRAESQ